VRVVASPDAVKLVRESGGKLFVRASPIRSCCGGPVTFLKASTKPDESAFRQVGHGEIELYIDKRLPGLPDELDLEVRGWRKKRVAAYWNGCAYVL
jgi:hypothetical protein